MCNSHGSLPTIEFVGGETQTFTFNVYSGSITNPSSLSKAVFSIISCTNKSGDPRISKTMTVNNNTVSVELDPEDTVELSGKFLYQLVLKDSNGAIEIPDQGVLYIKNNIDKKGTSAL